MRKDSGAVLKTHQAATDAVARKRNCDMADALEASETLRQKRSPAVDDATGNSDDLPATQEQRRRVGDLRLVLLVDKEMVTEHARWWSPGAKAR